MDTPIGTFETQERRVISQGYEGSVLQSYSLDQKHNRQELLKSPSPKSRMISKGCINVSDEVYGELVKSSRHTLKIEF